MKAGCSGGNWTKIAVWSARGRSARLNVAVCSMFFIYSFARSWTAADA